MPSRTVILLLALSAAQLTAATWSIVRFESTLASGTPYKLRVAPVDPADAFRGRYVAVNPTLRLDVPIAAAAGETLTAIQQRRGNGFAVLGTDAQGFARAVEIVATRPAGGDYLPIEYAWSPGGPDNRIVVSLPFDRYYMPEATAPAAQQRYADAVRRNSQSMAWLTVRVKNGAGVIDGLFIDGVPIEQLIGGSNR